nr:Degradation activator [Raoultella sp. NCTC 9187]
MIAVATELGYDRLPAIHAPRNQEEVALLVSTLQSYDPFIDAISQAREAAWRNEVLLTVYDYGDDVELAINIIRQLEQRNCIGIILASPVTTLVDMTDFQDCTRLPLVLLNQRDPDSPLLPSFVPDDYANAFQVTRHLISMGATRIAHITGESWMEATRQRLAGNQAALEQAGQAYDERLVRRTKLAVQRVLYRHLLSTGAAGSPGCHLLRQRLAGDRLLSGAGGQRRPAAAGYPAGGIRRSENIGTAHPAAHQYSAALQRIRATGGGVSLQSGGCGDARDAGRPAKGEILQHSGINYQ